MHELLTAIAVWLTANFGLSYTGVPPNVSFVSTTEMVELRNVRASAPASAPELSQSNRSGTGIAVEAFYDDATRTIYLSNLWRAFKAADLSVAVHEMVHHLQDASGLTYDCPEARERLAYQAQKRWLGLFGLSLESEFGLDPMTLLVRTNCFQ